MNFLLVNWNASLSSDYAVEDEESYWSVLNCVHRKLLIASLSPFLTLYYCLLVQSDVKSNVIDALLWRVKTKLMIILVLLNKWLWLNLQITLLTFLSIWFVCKLSSHFLRVIHIPFFFMTMTLISIHRTQFTCPSNNIKLIVLKDDLFCIVIKNHKKQ